MSQAADAILELCRMASEALRSKNPDEAARLFSLALRKMEGVDVPEEYRAAAQRFLAGVELARKEYGPALEMARALRRRVATGTDETRHATLEMIGELAAALEKPPPAEVAIEFLAEGIGCLELVRDEGERKQIDAALFRMARVALLGVLQKGVDSAEGRAFRKLVDQLDAHRHGMTKDGARCMEILLSYVTTASALLPSENVSRAAIRLLEWCDAHSLWDDHEFGPPVLPALVAAIDRLKTDAGKHKTNGDGLLAVEPYQEAARIYQHLEQHFGAAAKNVAKVAKELAMAAHALLGADALLARKTEAASRVALIDELRRLHPTDDKILRIWLEAPFRYVVALGQAHALDEMRVEVLRARDEAKCHLGKSEYKAWRKRMSGILSVKILDEFGF